VVLMLFEKVSGMRINFHKSQYISMNLVPEDDHEISHILCCPIGHLPFNYLGVPIHFEKLKREDLQPVIDKMLKKVSWLERKTFGL
jgi:hypothetical protein